MNKQTQPSLDEQLQAINLEKMPSRDLWKGIEYEITRTEEPHTESTGSASNLEQYGNLGAGKNPATIGNLRPMYAIAASVMLLGFVGYFSFLSGVNTTGKDLVAQLSEQHQVQKQQLLTSLSGQESTVEGWQEQLAELDEAALAIKKALENEPNNAALLKMLQKVHQQQINIIERVHEPVWQEI